MKHHKDMFDNSDNEGTDETVPAEQKCSRKLELENNSVINLLNMLPKLIFQKLSI